VSSGASTVSAADDIEIPKATAPWLIRGLVRVADLIIWPLLQLLRAVVWTFPRRATLEGARRMGIVLGGLSSWPTFRRNLKVIAGRGVPLDPAATRGTIAAGIVHQLQHVVDIVKVLDQRAEPLAELVEAEGERHLTEALAMGRGAILVSSHLGNWELAAAWIAMRGHPLNVVYHDQLSAVLDGYLRRLRESFGCRLHHQRRGLKAAIHSLRRNEVVAFVADQDGTRGGVFAEFFGVLVSVPRGAVRLALKYRCPIVHTWNRRLADGRYRQVFAPAYMPDGADGDAAEQQLVRRILRDFEGLIREDPAQWLLSYDRFKLRHVPRLEELGLAERAFEDQRWVQRD
jgi:KDO2-lipid IV(A) lauroyltransferase